MKKFEFSLSRMLSYKEQALSSEKNKLAALNVKKHEIEDHIDLLKQEAKRLSAELFTASQSVVTAIEVKNYNFQIENNRQYVKQLYLELETATLAVALQLKVVLEATQEVEGLIKLKEKQFEEYQYADLKAQELVISEFVSSKFLRDQAEE